ncbi:MAG TPA: fibronectin type III domain-containing protein [Phnomibacter sp.]|nr:fibronectin type III domain-containing protein [Phnomibacter sp.]
MFTCICKKIGVVGVLSLLFSSVSAQKEIVALQERKDLTLTQIEMLAQQYFNQHGTANGQEARQFQVWLNEAKFHQDEKGYLLAPDHDWKAYNNFQSMFSKSVTATTGIAQASAGPWVEKGPYSWNNSSSWNPGVGRVNAVAVHPLDTSIIYIASPGGGIWKSVNAGQSWKPLTDNNGLWMNMYSVAVDPTNTQVVYAGSSANTIIKSTDGGATWTAINSGMTGIIRKIVVQPSNTALLMVAAANGIWRSVNGGTSWTRTYTGIMEDIEWKPGSTTVLYASGPNAVLCSTNGGASWTTLGAANGIATTGRSIIAVSAANPEKVYVAQANGNELGFLFTSTDGGENFATTVTGSSSGCTNFFGYEASGCGTGGQANYSISLTVNPANADEVYLAGVNVFKSTNGGASFAPATAWTYPNAVGYNHAHVHDLHWVNKTIYSGSDGGIYKTTDLGDNWTDLSSGLGIRQFYRVANSKSNSQLFTAGSQDNGSTLYKNGVWKDWLGGDGMEGFIHPSNEQLIFGLGQNGSIYRSENQGASYTQLAKPAIGEWITPIDFEEQNNILYGGWNGVYKSEDLGNSWTRISGNYIQTTLTCLKVAPSDASFMYASKGNTLYITKDRSNTWTSVTLPAAINAITVSASNPEKIWLALNSSFHCVYFSNDGGTTFTNISDNLPSQIPRAIVVDDEANESVYVGFSIGVFYKSNTTAGWEDITENLPMVAVNDLKIQKKGHLLRIATYGRGVWERPLLGEIIQACGIPTNLTASALSTSAATLSWNAVDGAAAYTLEYQENGSSNWIAAAIGTANTTHTLSGLKPATIYNWRVAATCGNTNSDFASGQFQTIAICALPLQLNATGITETAANIQWTNGGNAISYVVAYKAKTATQWIELAQQTFETSWSLTALPPSTAYEFRVKANCTANTSEYALAAFTTATPVPVPVGCVTAYEPNNTVQQAKLLLANQEIGAAIGSKTDEDWYTFNTGSGSLSHIKLRLYNLPEDYDLYLYDKYYRLIGVSVNLGKNNEVLLLNPTVKNTTYYVKVVGKLGKYDVKNCYSLKLELNQASWPKQTGEVEAKEIGEALVSLSPNPATSYATLSFDSPIDEKADWTLVNAAGTTVAQKSLLVNKGKNALKIDVASLKPGIYQLQLRSATRFINEQVVVVR